MSQFGFKNIGHFFATVAGDIVKGARAVGGVLLQVQKIEPQIEAIAYGSSRRRWNWNGEPSLCWAKLRRLCMSPATPHPRMELTWRSMLNLLPISRH